MKKNPIYMYVLLALSAMGTLLTAQSFFGLAKVELTDEMAASLNLATALEREEYKAFLEKLIVALRGPIAWLLLSLLIGGLIAVGYFFLSKKDIVKATYAYMGQIGAFVLMSLHNFLSYRSSMSVITSDKLRTLLQASSLYALVLSVVVALVYLGILLYKLKNRPASDLQA
ncbi:ABC transporter permease [Streptococcus sp. XMC]|uniref:ABC transporter permease n=1 Tax=Streptococcus sp. XMC TaxID=2905972 RepID=UPI001E4AD285|nr:ABC transporter permease [Streptococcus sp. XMC]MCE3591969.1 ABC transporter permease [Streptococcus sp. XMC]